MTVARRILERYFGYEFDEGGGARRRKRERTQAYLRDWDDSQDDNDRFQKKYRAVNQSQGKALGGVNITYSPEVNATIDKDDPEAEKRAKNRTDYQSDNHQKILKRATHAALRKIGRDGGYNIPNTELGHGSYIDPKGKVHPEKAGSINLANVTSKEGKNIASAVKNAFGQQSVKMDDHNIRRVGSKRNPYRQNTETTWVEEE